MPRALVVDDQASLRQTIRLALEDKGIEAVTAGDGRAALVELCKATAEDKPFDAMLLDIVMPGVDGWRVMAAVKANPLWEDLPIIVITGQATDASDIGRVTDFDGIFAEKGADFMQFITIVVERILEKD